MGRDVAAELDRAYRAEWARVLATVTRQLGGDLGLAAGRASPTTTGATPRARWPTTASA